MNYEIVIPTLEKNPKTVESIPEQVTVHIQDEETISKARNAGVRNVNSPIVVMLDDDLILEPGQIEGVVEKCNPNSVVGMEGWNYNLIVTRVIVFYKDLWEDIGGFDEKLGSHMEDTDFAIKSIKNNYSIKRIPKSEYEHIEENGAPNRIGKTGHAWRGLYLAYKHPKWTKRLFLGMIRGDKNEY